MADIDVQQKTTSVWPWILGLITLALLVWLLTGMFDSGEPEVTQTIDPADPAAVEAAPPPFEPVAAPVAVLPVALIVQTPASYVGQMLAGEVRVAEVPSDRGFWIEEQGQRMFVILNDAPTEQPVDINPGQTLRISDAQVHQDLTSVQGEIDADTRAIVEGQPVFLTVDEANIEVAQPAV